MSRDSDFFDEFYSHYGSLSQSEFVESVFYQDATQVERVQHTIALLPEEVHSLLDVGAGFGVLLHEISKQRELQLEGLEISQSRIQWGVERGLKLRTGSADAMPYEDHSFDIVTCCEVLEHLPWQVYENSLLELQRVAKTWLLVSVPYDERRSFAACPYCGARSNPNYHLRSFAPSDFEGLFPQFNLHSLGTVGTLSKLTLLKAYLPAPWHPQMICPACNYRSRGAAEVKRAARVSKVKTFLRELPFPTRPRWLTGLFRRKT